jgi:hypothetical protein
LKLLQQIEREPFVPKAEVQANQLRRLSELLAHAEKHVPYYREFFRSLNITSDDIRSLKDLAQLPILTKDIVRERWRDLVREDVPLEKLSRHHSGGSTGVPLTFYRERMYMDASEAGTYRNFMQCGWRPGEMIAFFWGSNERLQQMSKTEFELRQRLRRMYQFDPFQSVSLNTCKQKVLRLNLSKECSQLPRNFIYRNESSSSRCLAVEFTIVTAAVRCRIFPPNVRWETCTSIRIMSCSRWKSREMKVAHVLSWLLPSGTTPCRSFVTVTTIVVSWSMMFARVATTFR